MEILVPQTHFLRVEEKIAAKFARKDKALGRDALALYLYIFENAFKTGVLRGVPQQYMAEECRVCPRSVQYALRDLERLGYLHVERAPGHSSAYILLLSARVLAQIQHYDLIENPGWYPRDEQRAAFRAAADAGRGVSSASQPAQQVRMGYAPHAQVFYKEDKKEKNQIPPSPQVAPGTACPLPCTDAPGGRASSCREQRRDLSAEFERLWAVWPLKKNRHMARRAFIALGLAGTLPSLESLSATVRLFAERDSHWRNGYPPELGHWLRGRRWEDEPFVRDKAVAAIRAAKSAPAGRDAREKVHWIPEAVSLPDLPAVTAGAVEQLCGLWPDAPARTPIRAYFQTLLARGQRPDPLKIVENARRYLGETASPGSLVGWLRSCAA